MKLSLVAAGPLAILFLLIACGDDSKKDPLGCVDYEQRCTCSLSAGNGGTSADQCVGDPTIGRYCCADTGYPANGICECETHGRPTCVDRGGGFCSCSVFGDVVKDDPSANDEEVTTCNPPAGGHCCDSKGLCICASAACEPDATEVPSCNMPTPTAENYCSSGESLVKSCARDPSSPSPSSGTSSSGSGGTSGSSGSSGGVTPICLKHDKDPLACNCYSDPANLPTSPGWTKVSACDDATIGGPADCLAQLADDGTNVWRCLCLGVVCASTPSDASRGCLCASGLAASGDTSIRIAQECPRYDWCCNTPSSDPYKSQCECGTGSHTCAAGETRVASCSAAIVAPQPATSTSTARYTRNCDGLHYGGRMPPSTSSSSSSSSSGGQGCNPTSCNASQTVCGSGFCFTCEYHCEGDSCVQGTCSD